MDLYYKCRSQGEKCTTAAISNSGLDAYAEQIENCITNSFINFHGGDLDRMIDDNKILSAAFDIQNDLRVNHYPSLHINGNFYFVNS